MQVHAFGQDFRGNQNAIIIFAFGIVRRVRIEIRPHDRHGGFSIVRIDDQNRSEAAGIQLLGKGCLKGIWARRPRSVG